MATNSKEFRIWYAKGISNLHLRLAGRAYRWKRWIKFKREFVRIVFIIKKNEGRAKEIKGWKKSVRK